MNKGERIYKELVHEVAGIWFISDDYGSKVMVKVPTPSIKSLIKGCKIEFIFGNDESHNPNIFHTCLKIYDDALNFQMIFSTHRFLDEHLSTAKILNLDNVQIQVFNELNICQAFGDLILSENDKNEIRILLGNPKKLYVGEFNKQIEESLDTFQNSFNEPSPILSKSLHLVVVVGQIINWKTTQNYIYHEGASVDINISGNEGAELEKEVFAVLYSLFSQDTIRNPQIANKSNTRELTDVLAFSEFGIFLVETKALGVINAEEDRKMERKVTGLQKQISKGINQLTGAMKKIAENIPIYDTSGKEILFARTLIPHGIILISEFLPFGEWDEVVISMMNAMIDTNSMIHVMDMKEFMQFIGHARGDKHMFDHFLVQRARYFVENPTMFHRTEFIDRLPNDETQT